MTKIKEKFIEMLNESNKEDLRNMSAQDREFFEHFREFTRFATIEEMFERWKELAGIKN